MYKLIDIEKKIYNKTIGERIILSDVSLEISDGDFIVIRGENGAGKSTLLSILGLVSLPTQGKVCFDEDEIANKDIRRRAYYRNSKIGFIFQDNELIPYRSVMDNVMVPLLIGNKSLSECKACALEKLKYIGINNLQKIKVKKLSGGERKKVAIARAIVNSPDIILADEPTASLDAESQAAVVELFKKINEDGSTVVVVTHDNLFDDLATREITMENGRIAHDYKK